MDLIYADRNKIELGVIPDCTFDCSFGISENDFACTVDMDNHLCEQDYFIYFDHTEYGGIVDSIKVSTDEHSVTYKGRTWHGILNNRVLCPAEGQDYLTLTGEANSVIANIIELVQLNDIFTVSDADSDLYIPGYQVRYEYAYETILAMLAEVNGKLKFEHDGAYVRLSVENVADYSNDEEFDSTQIGFDSEKVYNLDNHFICLGGGNLKDRHVIHLFTNDNGEVQPYARVEQPVSDSDYILDESQKVMTGNEERVYKYEYNGAQATENYVTLTTEPSDWANRYTEYFLYDDENEDYKAVVKEYADKYELTKVQPSDWSDNYTDFYYKNGDDFKCITDKITGKAYTLLSVEPATWEYDYASYYMYEDGSYKAVAIEENVSYALVKKQPNDWKKQYADYFYYYSDGVSEEYRNIEGRQKNFYTVQTRKPTDWTENYNAYFQLNAKGKYENVKVKKYIALKSKPDDWNRKYAEYFYYYSDGVRSEYRQITGTSVEHYTMQTRKPTDWYEKYSSYYYKVGSAYKTVEGVEVTGSEEKVAPSWKADTYYTQTTTSSAPDYESYRQVYKKGDAPTWRKKRYYTQESKTVTPKFTVHSKVYKKVMTTNIPEWKTGTYYDEYIVNNLAWENDQYYRLLKNVEIVPEFISGKYYIQYIDHYADLVANAVKKIHEIYDCDTIDINLSLEENYDIGDIVGSTEVITGISVWQPITQKIVKTNGINTTIEYETGGKK